MSGIKGLKLKVILLLGLFISGSYIIAQEEEDKGMKPVKRPWATTILIDQQTTTVPQKKLLILNIHHRFSKIRNIEDLYGIYGASNIRIGLNYGITDEISVGFGTEKNRKLQEFQGKYKILTQTKNNKIPVSVTYFGNIVIDGREEEIFGDNYEFSDRLSFLNQIIVSRKFTKALSVQLSGAYAHFNKVTELVKDDLGNDIGKWKNDYIAAMFGARYKFYKQMSAMVEYSHPFSINEKWQGQSEPKPNVGLGVEFATGTHAFQVFASNYYGIVAQENIAHSMEDMSKDGWHYGFNVTVRF